MGLIQRQINEETTNCSLLKIHNQYHLFSGTMYSLTYADDSAYLNKPRKNNIFIIEVVVFMNEISCLLLEWGASVYKHTCVSRVHYVSHVQSLLGVLSKFLLTRNLHCKKKDFHKGVSFVSVGEELKNSRRVEFPAWRFRTLWGLLCFREGQGFLADVIKALLSSSRHLLG